MTIIVDSTEFRQDRGLNKEDISLLRELGNKKLIKIEIPWFVYKESSTTSIKNLQTDLSTTINKLLNSERTGLHYTDVEKLKTIANSLNAIKYEVENSVNQNWEDFIKESNATLHKFNKDEAEEVFRRYFNGEMPFKSLKNREDIPDAFIYMTIKKIADKETVYLVSKDRNLTAKCSENKKIKIFESLKSLYENPDFETIKKKYYSILEKENFERAKEIIINQKDIIEDIAINFVDSISSVEIESPRIPSDNNEATLTGFSFENFKLNVEDIKHIGEEIFVPIEIFGYGLIDYFIFKADYWIHDDLPKFAEDWNDHYFRIEEEVEIKISKMLNFRIQNVIEDEDNDLELNVGITDYDSLEII